MFILKPSKFDTGDYTFSGKRLTTFSVNLSLTDQEIAHIHKQIQDYTKNKKTDYVLTFENERGDRVLAFDNMSESDKQAMKEAGYSDEIIEGYDYYELLMDR